MAIIKIENLPKDTKIIKEELKRIRGGANSLTTFRYIKINGLYFKSEGLNVSDMRYGKM